MGTATARGLSAGLNAWERSCHGHCDSHELVLLDAAVLAGWNDERQRLRG